MALVLAAGLMVAGGPTGSPGEAKSTPGQWHRITEPSGQVTGWVLALAPDSGQWALNRTGGIYNGIIQQKDIRPNGFDSGWRTIGRITSAGWVGPYGWRMRYRLVRFRVCREGIPKARGPLVVNGKICSGSFTFYQPSGGGSGNRGGE